MSKICKVDRSAPSATRIFAEIVVVLLGVALVLTAYLADHKWLDRHFLPAFFTPRHTYVLAASITRSAFAALGLILVFLVRPRMGRRVAHLPLRRLATDFVSIALAIVLALTTSELVLGRMYRRAAEERPADEEPRRRRDDRLGWTFVPSRAGHAKVGGRAIEYAFDSAGYRVRRVEEPVDPERPTVVFTGESSVVGQGLNWEETYPAQVAAILGTQCANIAVHGYASDQAYLRLVEELPRFRHPVAVVSLFMPALFDRNLDDDRPHVAPDLTWMPAEHRWRLMAIAKWLVPYRSDDEIERGIIATRNVLGATVELARTRGAVPLIVVPQFTPEDPTERMLRRRILDEPGLPYVWVGLDPSWRVPGDLHPDARAAHAITLAIATRLKWLERNGP